MDCDAVVSLRGYKFSPGRARMHFASTKTPHETQPPPLTLSRREHKNNNHAMTRPININLLASSLPLPASSGPLVTIPHLGAARQYVCDSHSVTHFSSGWTLRGATASIDQREITCADSRVLPHCIAAHHSDSERPHISQDRLEKVAGETKVIALAAFCVQE